LAVLLRELRDGSPMTRGYSKILATPLHGTPSSPLELDEKAGPGRLECPGCVQARAAKDLGPLVLPAPTKRELVAALVSAPDDPWWEARVLHAKLYPAKDRKV
ncbi:hypothetical protein, partial [Kitasatospora aureofaciens]|uniref:hypothetical protein n=1 Tax=Kitasatospora aureofaciens TaxID=1894 RepID=UPI0037F3BD0F